LVHEALSHIEKTLADTYRKEIDQEENVWRSLPFFATTVALQLATIAQFISRLPSLRSQFCWISLGLLGLTVIMMLVAVAFLFACIFPAKFAYIAKETELLLFTQNLISYEQSLSLAGAAPPATTFDAVETLKITLANQYGATTVHNRRINKRRELFRAIAGLALVLSMLTTLMFVSSIITLSYDTLTPAAGAGNDRVQPSIDPNSDRCERETGKERQCL